MIYSGGTPSACYYWFLFLVIHSLPCAMLIFFLPECFCLVQNNDCAQRNDAFTCMAAPMTRLTDQLNWIHVSDLLLSAALLSYFTLHVFSPSLPAYFVMSHTEFFSFSFYNNLLKWNKVREILNKTAVLYNLWPVKTVSAHAFTRNLVTFYCFSIIFSTHHILSGLCKAS